MLETTDLIIIPLSQSREHESISQPVWSLGQLSGSVHLVKRRLPGSDIPQSIE